MATPASARTTVRRGKDRAEYDIDEIRRILNDGLIAHVGVTAPEGPIVLPMVYGLRGDEILIHGALANAMMNAGREIDVCITVTMVDGLVIARTPFHNSMNYRCVVVRGVATAIDEPEAKLEALQIINDHVGPIWESQRAPSTSDVTKTLVLSVPLEEASAKVRADDPVDEEIDMDGPHWAGIVPLTSTWGTPFAAADLRGSPAMPKVIASMEHTMAQAGASHLAPR